jgi:hypothetical protein
MRRVFFLITSGLVLSCGLPARSQEGSIPVPKPTREHRLLATDVGTWDAAIKLWMDPKGAPTESKGTETNRMLPGGLWLLSTFNGELAGTPFHGRGQFGYDPVKKKYVGTWIDSLGTTPMLLEGTLDEATRTLTLTGETVDMEGKPARFREVETTRDDGKRVSTMFMKTAATGPDFVKVMEITYTRRPREATKKKAK